MNVQKLIIDIAVLAAGGGITVAIAYALIKNDIQTYFKLRFQGQQKEGQGVLLSLRLQAYERLILFVERINPANLLLRLHQPGISPQDLQALVLTELRAEYQHNITQQLYIEASTWDVVTKLKEDTVAMLNNGMKSLPANAAGVDLSRNILQHMAQMKDNPYELTLALIKKDIHQLF
ncbi:hypothetical protein [Pedobacter sp. MC2016-24]|uniref:DUF7935 family protein n=1 Tax=Pedobacter sp. MC2016-24 TaxID=2780090 RepID=UPI001881C5CD|nr:hypothetical protein [Pedobacter sp. MC2016-24]MBE9602796.1 hypothetical protein [Pedobacter sp. MC2016-24]